MQPRNDSGAVMLRSRSIQPLAEQAADPVGLDAESGADAFEGKGPVMVARCEPLRRLIVELAATHAAGAAAFAERTNGVLQHRGHQRELRWSSCDRRGRRRLFDSDAEIRASHAAFPCELLTRRGRAARIRSE